MVKDTILRDLLGELFLIIGGFILAETIVKQFLSLSANTLPWYVLPLFSVLLIIVALNFKNHKWDFVSISLLSALYLGSSIILIVLRKNYFISFLFFLWGIFIIAIITIISQILFVLFNFRRKK